MHGRRSNWEMIRHIAAGRRHWDAQIFTAYFPGSFLSIFFSPNLLR